MAAPFRLLPNGARRRLPDGSVRSLGANGLRYTDVEGSTGLGVASGGGATAGVYIQGVSVLMFSLSGNLTQDGFVGTTHLAITVGGLLSTRSYVMGTANLAFSTTAVATATRVIAGTTYFGVTTTGSLVRTHPLRGTVSLSTRVTGRMGFAQLLRGTTRLGFSLSGNLTTAAGGRWRELWLNFYDARQKVLNAIDANNRTLAKDAGTVANATATALIVTNTNVTNVDGRVTAESNRTTALAVRTTTAEGLLVSQGNAITTLGTRATSIEGVNTVQGNAITSLQTDVAGKASSTALTALTTTVTTQGAAISTQGTAITAVTAQAAAAVAATEVLDARVDVTEDGVTSAKAIHGVYLDVDGNISGTESINDGRTSIFSVMANVFRVISSGDTGLEWREKCLRAYSGSVQLMLGINFGAASNLCFWYGPNIGVAAATKANGTIWFDNEGTSYWGGEVLQGVLRAFKSNTTVSASASITTGAVSRKGKETSVSGRFQYQYQQEYSGGSSVITLGSGSTSAVVVLERRYGAGSWTELARLTLGGSDEVFNEMGAPSFITQTINGQIFASDVASISSTEYRTRIVTYNLRSHSVTSPGTTPLAVQTQYQSIESLE